MTPSPSDRRARGIAMRQARLARISGIRRRLVASALALFVATWLLITMLLISGHDPALGRTKTVSAAPTPATTRTPTTSTTRTTTPSATSATTTSSSAGAPSSSRSPTALTSSQS